MKIYPEELKAFKKYQEDLKFDYFSDSQKLQIREEINKLSVWHQKHPFLHNWISFGVLLFLISMDLYILSFITLNGAVSNLGLLGLIIGHGIFMYNIIGYTIHEGAYHRMIFLDRGPFTKVLAKLSVNICRLWYCDPIYYRKNHHGHHVHLGTEKDGTFTNMVHPKRFFTSMGPLASALNYNDYKLHTGETWTKSKILSETLSFALVIGIGLPLIIKGQHSALIQYVIMVFFGTWISFIIDRIRETTEHNLMPGDSYHGAREFGLNFAGLFFGGGPWGQPCHLSHHIAPGLPWYQQLRLHQKLMSIMTKEQKAQYTVHPVWGVLTLLRFNLTRNHDYIKETQK